MGVVGDDCTDDQRGPLTLIPPSPKPQDFDPKHVPVTTEKVFANTAPDKTFPSTWTVSMTTVPHTASTSHDSRTGGSPARRSWFY